MSRLSDMELFVAVVDEGGFSAAARRLRVSKSHVSKQIQILEERLGATLLHRTTRRLSLTDAGMAYAERARTVMENIDEAERAVNQLHAEPRGTLRLTVALSFGLRHVAPAVHTFMRSYPELSVEVQYDDRTFDLLAEGLDLAIRIGVFDDSSLVGRRLGRIARRLVASPEWVAAFGQPAAPTDIDAQQTVAYTYERGGSAWHFEHPDGRTCALRVNGRMRTNNGDALLGAVEAGLGVGVLPDFLLTEALSSGRLLPVAEPWEAAESWLWAVYPQNRRISSKVRLFIDFLAARFAETPWCGEVDGGAG